MTHTPGAPWGRPVNRHVLAANATGAVIAGLTDGRRHYCTVRAINAIGVGAAATPIGVTPHKGAPDPQAAPPRTTVDLTAMPFFVLPKQQNAAVLALR